MIVVIGQAVYRASEAGAVVDGLAARIALSAAGHGRSVELVGRTGEDPEGDAVLLALTRGGVGHVALRRDAGMRTPRASDLVDDDPGGETEDPKAGPPPSASETEGEPAMDAADVDLALRYLMDYRVIVLADSVRGDVLSVVSAAAGWADARMIVVASAGAQPPEDLPRDAIVLEGPDSDPGGTFATQVGSLAAALDDGDDPTLAFLASIAETGWEASVED